MEPPEKSTIILTDASASGNSQAENGLDLVFGFWESFGPLFW
jgi:hypothetical protein